MIKFKKKENLVLDNKDYSVFIDQFGNRYIESKNDDFHFLFRKSDGFTVKWGKDVGDDVFYNPFGQEIADIEITKICSGIRNRDGEREVCKFCYKCNCSVGDYMSFETFKKVFSLLNQTKTLTQIAFGVDASLDEKSNPDYWKIFDYCNENGVTPNVTVADITEETAKKMVKTFGAIACSYYPMIDKNRCYDSVEKLVRNAKEIGKNISINIHCLLSEETYDGVLELLEDIKKDNRLKGLNAIVFLSLKQKGRGVNFNRLGYDKFKNIIQKCMKENVSYGLDSCSANKFIKVLDELVDEKHKKIIMSYIEPCESTLFSGYVDCYGMFYPCSFLEKEGAWKTGVDMLKCEDYLKDIWNTEEVLKWREKSLEKAKCNGGCTSCPFYQI